MFKIMGAAMIIAAATAIGWVQSSSYASRVRQIRQMIHALERLETSIMYGYTPLDEAFRDLSHQAAAPLKQVFGYASDLMQSRAGVTTAKDAWEKALHVYKGRLSMKDQDLRILYELGASLGVSDREDQRNHLRHAVKRLEQEESAARDDYLQFGRMSKSLGVLSGIMLVILMY
ncbi:stage III sporulation protein SpoIIIAB [Paenibacillus aquistagni]|uniref:Stage III sporulation protein AB n=1 Tax=Paenibacillus aquistagni TaxID=1852522 RepID=A0A1X7JKU2_9BACL|nr:stage III sporulation protein SpoIIIAB [Paenibacillus aquistagni]SMG27944.1 stage III sporulation protein AB [Paenibacillus aquistagni]